MDINISGIKNQLFAGYQFVAEKTGVLSGHSVRLFKQGLGHLQQDVRLAAATIAVANILFLYTAILIATLLDKLFSFVLGADTELKTEKRTAKNIVLLTCMVSALAGMNAALAKGIKTDLSKEAIFAVSTASCVSYIFFNMWMVSKQDKPQQVV